MSPATNTPMTKDAVREKLQFADRRLRDLLALKGGDLPGANASDTHQLIQEFFFHVTAAIDTLAQLINTARALNLDADDVTTGSELSYLPTADPVRAGLEALYTHTRGNPVPPNPYADEAYIFRIYNYHHELTHGYGKLFWLRTDAHPEARFLLDPRDPALGAATRSVQDELCYMLNLVRSRCEDILALL